MAREPFPLGTWGSIAVRPCKRDSRGRVVKFEASGRYRDLDGRTRQVTAWGGSAGEAENNLRAKFKARRIVAESVELKSTDRVSIAAELFLAEVKDKVEQDALAPGTYDTYRYQYDKNLEPRIGELRLIEATIPRVNKVIVKIRDEIGVASAKTCKSILTGTFGLAVRHGAISSNPVREIKIGGKSKRKRPRALEKEEREQWFELLEQNARAVRADLVDLCKFMLATGERIGECLAVSWEDLNWTTGEIDCSHQIQRIKGHRLIRRRVKSAAGERILGLPQWALDMLTTRWMPGTPLDSPIFPSSEGGFRDPHNVQKALREARRPVGGERRQELGRVLQQHRRNAGLKQTDVVTKLGWRKTRVSLIETGRVRLDPGEATELADLYRLSRADRTSLLELTELAGMRSLADELGWVTAHVFRKTTATILEESGQSPRQIADQLGHAQTTTTMDDYVGRRARNPEAARHLEQALRDIHQQGRQTPEGPAI